MNMPFVKSDKVAVTLLKTGDIIAVDESLQIFREARDAAGAGVLLLAIQFNKNVPRSGPLSLMKDDRFVVTHTPERSVEESPLPLSDLVEARLLRADKTYGPQSLRIAFSLAHAVPKVKKTGRMELAAPAAQNAPAR
jgi:hypothetical protein